MKTIPFCIGLVLVGFLANVSAQAQFFTTDTTISSNDTNYDGDDIVALGCTLTVDGSHTFSDVLLVDGAMLTHSSATNGVSISGASGLNLTIENNIVIDGTSAIRADALNMGGAGMGASSNVVYSTVNFFTGGGGGHGGYGGKGYEGAFGGQTYGNMTTIAAGEMGSSGGSGSEGPGGNGAGSVNLTVGGAILVDGVISASGANGTNNASGGGSGGSISLTAESIVGAGSISANGGDGEGFDGGGGGGGRVVLNCHTNGLTGAITAFGGQGNVGGGAGTVYLAVSNTTPLLIIDNNGIDGTNTPLTSLNAAPDLFVTNGAIAETPLAGANPFNLRNLVIGPGSGFDANSNGNIILSIAGNALIASNAGLFADAVYSGLVDAGATLVLAYSTTGGGGGNGGFGGLGASGAAGGNSDYGSGFQLGTIKAGGPGGAGGEPGARSAGGNGGGVISINVLKTLTLNGTLSADGAAGVALGSGGGAGGDIAIQAGVFSGTGSISVNGGAGEEMLGGGGGGGRIYVYSPSNQFFGSLTAFAGVGFKSGGAGTILESSVSAFISGAMTIDAGGIVGTNTPLPQNFRYGVALLNGARAVTTGSFEPTNLFVGSNCVLAPLAISESAQISAFPGGVTVAAGGAISWDGAGGGFFNDSTAGRSVTVSNAITGGGGAGAGDGGNSAFGAAGGFSQGEFLQSEAAGGGGMGLLSGLGGSAGGSLTIVAEEGHVVIDGIVSANGEPGRTQGSGGGGGGSITINAESLSGTGIISANGGSGNLPYGGGGGGGEILVGYKSNLFTGSFLAYGGAGANYGGAGVVVLEPGQGLEEQRDQIILNNNGHRGTNTPLSGLSFESDLVISNGAIASVNAELSAQDLFVGSNAFIVSAQTQDRGISFMMNGTATIQQGGGIVLDGMGYPGATGPGSGTSAPYKAGGFQAGSGGSHGGYGGTSVSSATSGQTYDYFTQPEQPGSGGGDGNGELFGAGAGGGFVVVTVDGLLTLNGIISANGTQGTNIASGGGAGGSIALQASGLVGSGILSVNGGSGNLPYGGGGAGGMISLYLRTNLFSGKISAHGGLGFQAGGAGLIYSYPLSNPQSPIGAGLLIDNGGLLGTNTPLGSLVENNIVIAAYNLQVSGGAIVQPVKGATGFLLNNLLVESNGVITQTSGLGLLSVASQGNAIIGPGGAILVDGHGYLGGSGPGAGGSVKAGAGGGGGNGGQGGNGAFGAPGGKTNGSLSLPEELGSGGGTIAPNAPYSQGGGAIALSAKKFLTINGLVSANGLSSRYPGAGGGSGGSITLFAPSLNGNGVISANGGPGDPDLGGGGGGGRVAIQSPSNTFAGTISILGGSGFEPGAMGTLFITTNGIPESNVADAPQVSAELNPASGALTLKWTGSSDATYQVYYSTNLVDWLPYGAPISGTDSDMSLSAPRDSQLKFFRVLSGN